MNNKILHLVSFFALALSFSATLVADPSGYYRWKDSEGNLKLSDRPPEAGIKAEFVETPGSKKSRGSSEPVASSNTEQEAAATKPEQPLKMEIMPPKDPARCKQAKANMQAFEGAARIRITDADGTQRLITEEEKQVQVERAQKAIRENCN
ncbi:DUF4124 domain-containing protein [Dasania marina]|uniref:DUF4124 domain-containing protein n=1 Tax=Dasania marina TaxID=471499 RepID=UPI0030DB3F0C|tara:strand:- start:146818 stop:147270 length:453 start_codon:yes stop_codon:yes gene_type:complete